ncbi:MAG TPA: aspartate aminotransferase family protein [Thermomicrobiales bacterium]|nr:aspartate aminotransferase family protein [Thermomicrobiales bacterium]
MATTAVAPTKYENVDLVEQGALDHVWVHYAPWVDIAAKDGLRIMVKGDGSKLWDIHGREYIDVISGLWLVNAGHGRKEIGAAMGEQAGELAYVSSMNFTTAPAVETAERLAALTPGDLNRVFFVSGGSEAVETALKIAKQVQAMRGFPRRYKVIARRGSYHGMTHGAMSLTATRNENHFGPFMYGVSHVPHPNRYRSDFGVEGEQADIMAAKFVELEIENQNPETVAAVIGEPISSAAGLHVPGKIYWQMLREICDKHGVLLIADEVINGFGRTGTMFAIEQYDIVPDIMTVAKGITSGYAPMGAAIIRDSVFEIFKNQEATALGHLLTFGGHPVAAVAANRNLQIFEEEDLVGQSKTQGVYLKSRLEELRSHPTVGDVRGVGLYCGVELVSSKTTKAKFNKDSAFIKRVNKEMLARGLVTRLWDVIHVAPPLVVTKEEIDQIVAGIDEALTIAETEVANELTA